jgi:hypothetical protein
MAICSTTNISKIIVAGEEEEEADDMGQDFSNNKVINYKEFVAKAKLNGKLCDTEI